MAAFHDRRFDMAKKQPGMALPTTEPQLEQPDGEPAPKPAPLTVDDDTLALMAAQVFASLGLSAQSHEAESRRQHAVDWAVQVAQDIARAIASR